MIDVQKTFEKFEDWDTEFEQIDNPPHPRPDVCAYILLDRLLPRPGRKMVCGSDHDIIWLDADIGQLAEVATEDDILSLVRCGVFFDTETDSLAIFT
jgi:hypothetical protein